MELRRLTAIKHRVRCRVRYFMLLLVLAAILFFQVDLLHRYPLSYLIYGSKNTLFDYAAVDIDEPRLRQEILDLIQRKEFNKEFDARWRPSEDSIVSFRSYLRDWWDNKRYNPYVMADMNDMLFNREGVTEQSNRTARFKSCAVVGNSGILLNQEYGTFIDEHEIVIRLNYAPTRGFERYVGSKTSIAFINSNVHHNCCAFRTIQYCNTYNQHTLTIMYICQPIHFFDYIRCNSTDYPLSITDPSFDTLCARIVKYYSMKRFTEITGRYLNEWGDAHGGAEFHHSSGMQAVMLGVGICEKVSVFGFGKEGNAKHHYHDVQKSELSLHDFEAEYELYEDLRERPWEIPFISDEFEFPLFNIY